MTYDKVLVVITEDWFALSHFKPLLAELCTLAKQVSVATASSGRERELEALGLRVLNLRTRRGSRNPLDVLSWLNELARSIDAEDPDVVHAIAMQAMVMTSLALRRTVHRRPVGLVYHLTGTGYLGTSRSPFALLGRPAAIAAIRSSAQHFNTHLLVENLDDRDAMVRAGVSHLERTTILPGAGVDPSAFAPLPHLDKPIPSAAFVGRMLRSKGVHTLIDAHQILQARGVEVGLALCGKADEGAHQSISDSTLRAWGRRPGVTWYGHVKDVRSIWGASDIAVVPSLGGEGLPRSMLEAAACSRPLVVSDVPGCRHFVRDGIEGFVVAPGDAAALGRAIERLAGDKRLREKMGGAARRRVLAGYTEAAVRQQIRKGYETLRARA